MRLSFDRLWVILALALPALLSLLVAMPAVDLAYQVRAGDEILRAGALPAVDTWTFTIEGKPWLDQQWLAQVLFSVVHGLGGWELLFVARAGLVVAALGLLLGAMIERGAPIRVAAVLALVAFLLAAPALALRPQLIAIVLFCALLYISSVRWWRPYLDVVAVLVVVVWANVHGSFVLAPLVLGYIWLEDVVRGRPWRRSLVMILAGTAATLVNPFGIGVWSYAASFGVDPVIRETVSEWQRTTPLTISGALFYASLVATVVFLLVQRRTKGQVVLTDWLWVAGWGLVGAWAERGLAWWPFAAAFIVSGVIGRSMGYAGEAARGPRPNRLNAAVAMVLGTMIVVALPWWRPTDSLTGRQGLLSYAPSGLAQSLASSIEPGARVFTQQTWASWFEWAVPDARSFLDSRFELFPGSVFTVYGVIAEGGDPALTQLDGLAVNAVVVAPDSPLATTLHAAGWLLVDEDGDGAVFTRP
jgi:hypothetical protein